MAGLGFDDSAPRYKREGAYYAGQLARQRAEQARKRKHAAMMAEARRLQLQHSADPRSPSGRSSDFRGRGGVQP